MGRGKVLGSGGGRDEAGGRRVWGGIGVAQACGAGVWDGRGARRNRMDRRRWQVRLAQWGQVRLGRRPPGLGYADGVQLTQLPRFSAAGAPRLPTPKP